MDRIHRMATLTRNSAVSFDLRRSDPLCRVGCQIAIRRFRSLGETRWVYFCRWRSRYTDSEGEWKN